MKRVRTWGMAPAGIAAATFLLLAMVAAALNVTGVIGRRTVGSPAALDYSAPPFGGFFPLRQPYVASVLGEAAPAPASPDRTTFHRSSRPVTVTHELTNDAVAQAYGIRSVPFTARTDSADATRASSDPAACSGSGSTVWYRYVSSANETLVATTSAAYPVTLGAFIEPASRSSSPVTCDSHDDGLSRIAFSAFAGTAYLFQITGRPGGGRLEFSLEPALKSTPISVLKDGAYAGANYDYGYPKISSNGRFVVFESDSTELDPRCAKRADGTAPCGGSQVFIHDLKTDKTELASLTSDGGVPNNISVAPWVSGDGRYVTFSTNATNVGPGPDLDDDFLLGGPEGDVFRRDVKLGKTERVTIAQDGHELNGGDGSISDDGRFIAFDGDFEHRLTWERQGAGVQDVYIKDMLTGEVTTASVGNRGERGNHDSITPQISPDGYYVAFWSRATTLSEGPVPVDDVKNRADIFQGRVYVYDLHRHRLSFECVPESGIVSNDHCIGPSISRDGRYSLFWSDATDLIPGAPSGGTLTHPIINLYLRDRRTGQLELINVTDGGTPVGEAGELQRFGVRAERLFRPWVSADGSVVAFDAAAALAPGDRDGIVDAYVRDRTRGRTIRVSETSAGRGGDDQSVYPYPTGDGSVVAFLSLARNLARPEEDSDWDMFVCRWRPS